MAVNTMNFLRKCTFVMGAMLGASALTGCDDVIYDGEGDCQDYVYVHLKYDYNIQRADMRAAHVGYAIIYALDDNNKIVAQQTVANTAAGAPLKENDFAVRFEGLQPGKYHFMAMAMQRPYEECAAGKGARFRATLPPTGDINVFNVKLDRNATAVENDLYPVDAPSVGLDTLWIGQSKGLVMPPVDEQRSRIHRDTVSLVRDTKYLNLTLHQIGDAANIHDKDFMVRIIDANGWLGYDNELKTDQTLLYTPHAQWTTAMSQNGVTYYTDAASEQAPEDDPIVERAAHFEISFSRLMYYASAAQGKNAVLQIVNVTDGTVPVQIALPYYLAFGRNAFATQHYSEQEYLDREYQYNLDFFLQEGNWKFLDLKVNIMAWAIRIQNVIF